MLSPRYVNLTQENVNQPFVFIPDEPLYFVAMQEVDSDDEPLAKVWITSHGKIAASIIRILRKYVWTGRNYPVARDF